MTDERKSDQESVIDRLVDEVSTERLTEYNRTIAQWQRLSGTDEERQAFDYIEGVLREIGLSTQRYAPVCLVSLPGAASLTVLADGEQLTCITHSFSTSTGPQGISGELVYVGAGTDADYAGKDVRGKIVLAEGLAGPNKVGPAERNGVAGVIHISGPEIHEMIISPIWGSPTPDNVDQLPTLPHISIDNATGDQLKRRLDAGRVEVRLTTEVDTGWRPLPVLVASLRPERDTDEYVLFSGHVDSWYYGAMDNGSANASMMEAACVLANHRDLLRREVRLAFWSGHSHARYGTSAWFADEFWHDLYAHCVAHVNIDSPGGIGATVLTTANTMAETYGLAHELIEYLSDQELGYHRIGRMGDQSFWGVGVPSLYCSISNQPAGQGGPSLDTAIGSRRRGGGGGLGWWWHTPDDTLDKIDPVLLTRDARILLATVYRVSADAVLPFDQTGAVDEITSALNEIAGAAGSAFDLADVKSDADALREAAVRLRDRCRQPASDAEAARLNRCLMQVSRALIPVNYTVSGQFSQDPALGSQSLPGLRGAMQLSQLSEGSPERYLLENKLRRERNRVRHALIEARHEIEATLA